MRPRLLFLLKYCLFWLAFFVVGKLVFLAWYFPQTAALPLSTTLGIVFYGLRMDATATAFVAAVPFLLVLASTVVPWRLVRPLLFWWTAPLVVFVGGLTAGDLELYKEWGYRIDATWLQYLRTPTEMGASIASQPLWADFLVIGVLATAGIWALRRWILPPADAITERSFLAIPVIAFLTALLVIPARGGTQLAPITQSTVYFSTSDFANQAAVNVAWSFFNGLYYHDADKKNPYVVMPAAEAKRVRDSLVGVVDTAAPTRRLLRTRRPNIILIIWEGFSAKTVGVLGGKADAVPEIDSLSRTGILFDRFYASGNRTDKGVGAVLSGYPALQNTSVLKEPRKYVGLPGLARTLDSAGYDTEFLYGGELAFDNLRAFVLTNGFSRIVGKQDFPPSSWSSKWGAHDHVLFQRMLADADSARAPFFLTALTLSSHEPYDIPVPFKFGDSTKTAQYLSSLHYVDSALGTFVREASKRPWWDSTVMIILADHGHRLPVIDLTSDAFREETHHIPLLWIGGALAQHGVVLHELGDQTDLGPTLLAQMDLPRAGWKWGRDLFAPGGTPFVYYTFQDGFGYLTERGGLMWDNVGHRVLRSFGTVDSLDQRTGAALQQLFVGDFVAR
ncbi:MAG TPA: sulfatase-like hydrolase/transferase [Solirubrobacterales bacterium]|nr:sulfatase-like hydrolase/transferase [Solirubrobacterales bacterium]